jgi:hypothetical protein
MHDLGNCKNSVGLKPNAEWKKDAKAPSYKIGAEWVANIGLDHHFGHNVGANLMFAL